MKRMCACSAAMVALLGAVTVEAQLELYYTNNFDTPVGPEWSQADRDVTPWGQRMFLGQFGAESVTLTLSDLPPHSTLLLTFDLFIIGSWDGNYVGSGAGPDIWQVWADEGAAFTTTFNTHTFAAQYQAYPDIYPGGQHPSNTGATEVNTLGYSCIGSCTNAVYHFELALGHANGTLTLGFGAANLEALSNESWGLDNLQLSLEGSPCDFNRDAYVDLFDYEGLEICIKGPNVPPNYYCSIDSDIDDDGDVDLADFQRFQNGFCGPDYWPVCL